MSVDLAVPETRYAETDGLSIAYQVCGSGAQDLVLIPGIVSHLEAQWQEEANARMLRRLARSFRVICFDKRGQGLSDRFEGVPTLEQRMDDVRAVMQAAASTKAVLFAPGRSGDAAFCDRLAKFQRQTASPSAMRRLIIANDQIDVRAILPQIRRPTMIIQRRGDRVVRCGNGRYLADHVPGAVYLELPGEDHFLFEGDMEAIVDAVAGFALAEGALESPHVPQRFLSTVLFTDIVGSTELAGRLGDRAWRDLLQRFHGFSRAQIEAFRGREIDTAGDGYFAIFDGPARAMRCADAMVRGLQALGITIRAGLHTGEVESLGDKVSGMAVHIGARVMSKAGDGEVWVSSTSRDLVAGSGIGFDARGTHALKGVPGEWALHRALVPAEG